MSTQLPALAPRLLRHRFPRVCVAVVGKNPAEMVQKAEQLARDNSFIEFRLDYLSKPALFFPKLKSFIEYHPHVTLIATCRRAKNGGKFNGSVASQVEVLAKAAATGCHLVDIELESAAQLKTADWNKLKKNASVILSFHDFRSTKKLEETFAKMEAYPADFIKIVSTANSLYDNVVMMKFLEKKSDQRAMIGLCMGEQGIISRLLCVRAGSIFTFGAASPGEETAPGQIAARTLRDTYRIDQIDAATRVYGVVGDPVAHSLSPAMMNTAFRRENLNAIYLALHAKAMSDLMACVRDIPIHGFSVTMPYKTEILKYLDKTDAVTAKIGACNTVIRAQDGRLYGFNTDVAGIIRPLEQRMPITGSKFLVLGAGGAARAAVFGLKERGGEVYVMNRTASAAQKLAKQARAKFIQKPQLAKLSFDAIINATPVGMKGEQDKPLLSEKELNCRYVFEMVYSPAETKFTRMARAKGIHVIPGVEMFVHQGARQFEIWTGKPAPVDEMLRVALHALEQRAAMAKNKT
ncbi:MAG: 3-dehydroquinate dehydratase / shikimate dehydrogenase [Candidatus Angelobacter sp.]|jgi:3-dehydroquinate dehydratase/shikimate dehydrogenase|nr:3-dehydroquinate dehydratase / shikimate dehydrogenase [Candidatus Angelobacter sp.]